MKFSPLLICLLFLFSMGRVLAGDYAAVDAIFKEHCLDCHSAPDPDAKLFLDNFEGLMKGGESGPAVTAGKSAESLLVKMVEGKFEKDGKKLIMPPGKRKKLATADIHLIRDWIDSGAHAPKEAPTLVKVLNVPKITPPASPTRSIYSLAYSPSTMVLAVGRHGDVELISPETRATVRTLSGHHGNVNALVFSTDGKLLYAAAGETALFGEVRIWNVADGSLVRTLDGHVDAIYALALSPDGKTLATGSYDQKIKLWATDSGKELKTLSGHNGCVFGLSFRRDGKILASASGDRTVKLWDVVSGERRDTLSQSLKELYTVQFAPDGKRLFAAGVDNRIRVWEISEQASETTNPLLFSKFGHEGAILKIAFSSDGKTLLSSADDRTLKLWEVAGEPKERTSVEKQPDWAGALAFLGENKTFVAGRMDGSIGYYETAAGKASAPPKPELVRSEPRGLQRGKDSEIKLIGKNLTLASEIKFSDSRFSGQLVKSSAASGEVIAKVKTSEDLARGAYELWLSSTNGDTAKIKVYVDDLPQFQLHSSPETQMVSIPSDVWGLHEQMGQKDKVQFEVAAGQTIVFDVSGKSIGSKADVVLTLTDKNGKVLASNNGFDGTVDPFVAYTFAEGGAYTISVHELLLGASADHFYRLSLGAFPFVTACYPLSVPANVETSIELIGYNLPANHVVPLKTSKAGEMDVPIDPNQFRSRRAFKVLVADGMESIEKEPNDVPTNATAFQVPGGIAGRIEKPGDVDEFRFSAKSGQQLIIETMAAQRSSPVDTKIEVLSGDGKPVPRLLLQAVRNSAITFRSIDSNTIDARVDNWEEMELNELMYFQGEVVKIFRMPQGPDSGFNFYTAGGRRRAYFDTSATAHSVDEPCYIVEPHPPGTKLLPNGLPAFQLFFANDDDADRKLGADSKLAFTAPSTGEYVIRVTDTRGAGGDRYVYRLVARTPKPDFRLTVNGANPTVNAGSGQSFSVSAERLDGFEGEIQLDISDLPPGFTASTPLVIQAGHTETRGTLNAAVDAPSLTETNATQCKIMATAIINGEKVTRDAGTLGKVKLGDKPKLFVSLQPEMSPASAATNQKALDITIAPGQSVPARLKVQRNGHQDLVTFTVDNLPHGVIVDNIGLNGVLIPKGEDEREIFLTAAKWVPETDRLCFAIENQAGRQTSLPVWIHIRKPGSLSASR